MFTPAQYVLARQIVLEVNTNFGGPIIQLVEPPAATVTLAELRALATDKPGEYLAANAFRAIKGRCPTRGEAVKLGHMLGHLSVAQRKIGPDRLWRLDNAFATRAH